VEEPFDCSTHSDTVR